MKDNTPNLQRSDNGTLAKYTFPGMYPIYYITADGGTLCAECAIKAEAAKLTADPDDPQWYIIAADVNYGDESLFCSDNDERIAPAYGD